MLQYGKVTTLGNDPAIEGILNGEVEIEEKADGSNFRILINPDGTMQFGSKSVDNVTDKTFDTAVQNATKCIKNAFDKGLIAPDKPMTIFAEYLSSPKHNTLRYDRVPLNNIVIFDIMYGDQWLDRNSKEAYARILQFDVIPLIYKGNGLDLTAEKIEQLLHTTSYLGGVTIEGIVIKNYGKTYDGIRYPHLANYFMRGKRVRKEFQEMNRAEWGIKKGHIEGIIESLRTPQRFEKVYQHLRDAGKLQYNMKDMPVLIRELHEDILTENGDEIKQAIWQEAWNRIRGGVAKGLPEFYKQKLTENLIEQEKKEPEALLPPVQ